MLITSSTPGEGKSTTAIHLAMAHAEQGRKTLLIDADLRRPTLAKKLGISDSGAGLGGIMLGQSYVGGFNRPTLQPPESASSSCRRALQEIDLI